MESQVWPICVLKVISKMLKLGLMLKNKSEQTAGMKVAFKRCQNTEN